MKRSNVIALAFASALMLAGLAFAAAESSKAWAIFQPKLPSWLGGGLYIGTTVLGDTGNKVTRALGGSIAFDFASVTTTCEDSTGITVTGALTGDACFTGPPTTISGAGTGLHSTFSCYVSAADTVKVRHCAAGTADNPASATYFVRVISSQ